MRIAVAGGTGLLGRHVACTVQSLGHNVVVVSRSQGVDLRTGQGLDAALAGVDAVIDVTNSTGTDRSTPDAFFADVTRQLQSRGAEAGVRRLITLSIVGIERAPNNAYYAAKLHQEALAMHGPVPAAILRATQFHEFAAQMLRRNERNGTAAVPVMRVQPVAARTVAERLLELAQVGATGRAADLAGPEEADLIELSRAFVSRFALPIAVTSTPADPSVPFGATLPEEGAQLAGPSFAEWLETEDAARQAADWAA